MKQKNQKNKNSFDFANVVLVLSIVVAILVFSFVVRAGLNSPKAQMSSLTTSKTHDVSSVSQLQADLFPKEGFKTKITLGDTVPKLAESGALDLEKFQQAAGSKLADWQMDFLTKSSDEPLVLTSQNANFVLTVLWPLGTSNKNPILDEMDQYEGKANLASTGGWPLGKKDAIDYFNKVEIVKLTPKQQENFEEVAKNSYRPCCNNPTSFPDCNHGAALLGLLELGASQGMSKGELYKLALQANTLWFPQEYLSTAVYFKSQGKDYWSNAEEIMSAKYSSGSGWAANVYTPLQEQGGIPQADDGGGSCGV